MSKIDNVLADVSGPGFFYICFVIGWSCGSLAVLVGLHALIGGVVSIVICLKLASRRIAAQERKAAALAEWLENRAR